MSNNIKDMSLVQLKVYLYKKLLEKDDISSNDADIFYRLSKDPDIQGLLEKGRN